MSNMIEIDDEVLGYLESKAKPFVDTPNSVLRRVLGLDGGRHQDRAENGAAAQRPAVGTPSRIRAVPIPGPVHGRAPRGTILPEEAYWVPALRYLVRVGGE